MRFQVEATVPTKPEDLKAALEAARDAWVKKTPQESDREAEEAFEKISKERQRMSRYRGEGDEPAQCLRDAVKVHASTVEKNSATLDPVHAGCVKLIDGGIAAAQAQAEAMGGKPVRVTIVGHFEQSLDGTAPRPLQRLSVHVDIAG